MGQIVHYPRRNKLRQRNRPKFGMLSRARQIFRLQMQLIQVLKILPPQRSESVKQLANGPRLIALELSEAIERNKRPVRAMLKDHLQSRHPIRKLAMNQMPDHVVAAPRLRPLVRAKPVIRKISQQKIETCRSLA